MFLFFFPSICVYFPTLAWVMGAAHSWGIPAGHSRVVVAPTRGSFRYCFTSFSGTSVLPSFTSHL